MPKDNNYIEDTNNLFSSNLNGIDYEKELNENQLKTIKTTEGPVLVIAGAGSGKTNTLIYRTVYLIEKGVDPENILLLTFTRKAAQEMLKRASSILDNRCKKIAGGTFHSFANLIIRNHAPLMNLKGINKTLQRKCFYIDFEFLSNNLQNYNF